jgi:hypothetical protein
VEIPNEVFQVGNQAEDIALVRGQGYDDNEPAPENVPGLRDEAPVVNDLYEGQSWGWDGIDQRIVAGGESQRAVIPKQLGPPRQVVS